LKIASKLLQIETWLLLTAYRKLQVLYPMVPLATPYDLPLAKILHDWHTTVN